MVGRQRSKGRAASIEPSQRDSHLRRIRPTDDQTDRASARRPASQGLWQSGAMVAWTGIDELDGVLSELRSNAEDLFGDDLVGVYVQGSFALGGADSESDCDFLVVVSTPIETARLAGLRAFFSQLRRRPGYWNQHLEGSYALAADLAELRAVGRPWPYIDHGSDQVILDPHCNTEVSRWIHYEHGVTVHSPSPRTLLQPVPKQMMRTAARRNLRQAISSWRPLLKKALVERGQRPWDPPIDADLARRTEEFVEYVGRVAEQANRRTRSRHR